MDDVHRQIQSRGSRYAGLGECGGGMKNFLVLLLILSIFGPRIEIYNKAHVLRFRYTGILYGFFWMIYGIILRNDKEVAE